MNCQEVVGLLSEYLDGELNRERRAEFDSHIGQCSSCSEDLAALEKTVDHFGRLPKRSAPSSIAEGLRQYVRSNPPLPMAEQNLFRRYFIHVASIAAILLLALLLFVFKNNGQEDPHKGPSKIAGDLKPGQSGPAVADRLSDGNLPGRAGPTIAEDKGGVVDDTTLKGSATRDEHQPNQPVRVQQPDQPVMVKKDQNGGKGQTPVANLADDRSGTVRRSVREAPAAVIEEGGTDVVTTGTSRDDSSAGIYIGPRSEYESATAKRIGMAIGKKHGLTAKKSEGASTKDRTVGRSSGGVSQSINLSVKNDRLAVSTLVRHLQGHSADFTLRESKEGIQFIVVLPAAKMSALMEELAELSSTDLGVAKDKAASPQAPVTLKININLTD